MRTPLVVLALIGALALPGLAATPARAAGPAPRRIVVGAAGDASSLADALAQAGDGDEIVVQGGLHPGPVVVERSITLSGEGWPVIDGGGDGTVVTLAAKGAAIRGFEIRGSGSQPEDDHAGITLSAPNTIAEHNRLRDVLFGVFVAKAPNAVVRDNDIESKPEYDAGRKGDGIRVWYSTNVLIEGNHVHDTRDLVLWYSNGIIVRGNDVERNRYGVHIMYCDDAQIQDNRFIDNSVGIYTMYSKRVDVRRNLLRGQRGPSGYALGFKDVDDVMIAGNVLVDNRAGLFMDGLPFSPNGRSTIEDNIIAFNDIGAMILPAVRGNVIQGNTWWDNNEQVAQQGGGQAGRNVWHANYWSDYAGLDLMGAADGGPDGVGDEPYRSEHFFEGMIDREPMLRALIYSPAAQAIEMAAQAFPIVRPLPKFVDDAPRMLPGGIPPFAELPPRAAAPQLLVSLALLGIGAGLGGISMMGSLLARRARMFGPPALAADAAPGAPIRRGLPIAARDVRKRYGAAVALDGASFELVPGESLALWGNNGAGKTTLIKAILGLIQFEGELRVAGFDPRRDGKRARAEIGYVPQELAFYDWSAAHTLAFYARIKRVDAARIPALLARLGLAEHAGKLVSELSGGLKQRLALAIALLADPPVLLLDEPTASLDAAARADYLALLRSIKREGRSVVFSSHHLDEVEALADRALLLDRGRVVASLSPEALRARMMPDLEVVLWIKEAERGAALNALQAEGMSAHLNGRGTLVARVPAGQKLRPLDALMRQGIVIDDFEVGRG